MPSSSCSRRRPGCWKCGCSSIWLIGRGLAGLLDQPAQVRRLEVRDADRAHQALVAQLDEGPPGVDVAVVRGHGPVDQVEVEVSQLQPLEAALAGPPRLLAALVVVPALGRDEDVARGRGRSRARPGRRPPRCGRRRPCRCGGSPSRARARRPRSVSLRRHLEDAEAELRDRLAAAQRRASGPDRSVSSCQFAMPLPRHQPKPMRRTLGVMVRRAIRDGTAGRRRGCARRCAPTRPAESERTGVPPAGAAAHGLRRAGLTRRELLGAGGGALAAAALAAGAAPRSRVRAARPARRGSRSSAPASPGCAARTAVDRKPRRADRRDRLRGEPRTRRADAAGRCAGTSPAGLETEHGGSFLNSNQNAVRGLAAKLGLAKRSSTAATC